MSLWTFAPFTSKLEILYVILSKIAEIYPNSLETNHFDIVTSMLLKMKIVILL
jgi:hypothetical protein